MGLLDKLFKREPVAAPSDTSLVAEPTKPMRVPSGRGSITWVPPGHPVNVGGRVLDGGMLYVGSRAMRGDGHGAEPALIDPSLPVDWKRPDIQGVSMGYWPAYHDISPAARAGYLSWLLDGRRDPRAYIGYVFLFFYGLERRVLVDLTNHPDDPEIPAIAQEVRRLVTIYRDNGSFQRYGTRFLDLLDTVTARTAPLSPPDWQTMEPSWPLPSTVRVAIGRYIAAGQPIPAEWALVLLRTYGEISLRTPAVRCADEFDELFCARYRARFGDGMVVQPPAARIEVDYYPSSGGLRGEYRRRLGDMPDVCAASSAIHALRDLAGECTDALDAYSRFLGRNPDAADDPAAAGLLPDELLASHGGPALTSLRTWAHDQTAQGAAVVGIDDVVQRWAPGRDAKLAKKDAVSLAGLLAKFGVGVEPDVRFSGKTPTPGSKVVLFPLPDGAPAAPSPQYAAASVLVHLTAVVASADGTVGDDERLHLARHLEASLNLDAPERARLEAHLQVLTTDKASLAGVKARVDGLDASRRAAIGEFLVDLAAADGAVTPGEIGTLTKLYKLLGLDEANVYSTIHALGTDSGPVTVRPADTTNTGHAIPPAPATPSGAVVLDADKVRARLAETATVTALLADIFTEDEPAATPTAKTTPARAAASGVSVEGLDAAHSALADTLRSQASWARAEVEVLAADLDLPLLDGALDRVNEAAMDCCGEPLVEGEDPLEINDYAAEELFA